MSDKGSGYDVQEVIAAMFDQYNVSTSFADPRDEAKARLKEMDKETVVAKLVSEAVPAVGGCADHTDDVIGIQVKALHRVAFTQRVVPYTIRVGSTTTHVSMPYRTTCAELLRHVCESTNHFNSLSEYAMVVSNVCMPLSDENMWEETVKVFWELRRPLTFPIKVSILPRSDLYVLVRNGNKHVTPYTTTPILDILRDLMSLSHSDSADLPTSVPFPEVMRGYDTALSTMQGYYTTETREALSATSLSTNAGGTSTQQLDAKAYFRKLLSDPTLQFDASLMTSIHPTAPLQLAFSTARLSTCDLMSIFHGDRAPVGFTAAGRFYYFGAIQTGTLIKTVGVPTGSIIYLRFTSAASLHSGGHPTEMSVQPDGSWVAALSSYERLVIPVPTGAPTSMCCLVGDGYELPGYNLDTTASHTRPSGESASSLALVVGSGHATLDITCTVCFDSIETGSPHIECTTCTHLICRLCFDNLPHSKCPMCNEPFGDSPQPSRFLLKHNGKTNDQLRKAVTCVMCSGSTVPQNPKCCTVCSVVVCDDHVSAYCRFQNHTKLCAGSFRTMQTVTAVSCMVDKRSDDDMCLTSALPLLRWNESSQAVKLGGLDEHLHRCSDVFTVTGRLPTLAVISSDSGDTARIQGKLSQWMCVSMTTTDVIEATHEKPIAATIICIDTIDVVGRVLQWLHAMKSATTVTSVFVYAPSSIKAMLDGCLAQSCVAHISSTIEDFIPLLNDLGKTKDSTYHASFTHLPSAAWPQLIIDEPIEFFPPSTLTLSYFDHDVGMWKRDPHAVFNAGTRDECVVARIPHFSTFAFKSNLYTSSVQVDKSFFNPRYDFTFPAVAEGPVVRGNKPYFRPVGSQRNAVNVSAVFASEGAGWLSDKSLKKQWPVGYHGTSNKNISSIAKSGLQCGGTGSVPMAFGNVFGCGIYTTPYPSVALRYSPSLKLKDGSVVNVVLQTRLRPNVGISATKARDQPLKDSHGEDAEWVLPTPQDVRLYAISIFTEGGVVAYV